METDIESKIIPKDAILVRMQNGRLSSVIRKINGAILKASNKGKYGATIVYNAQLPEVNRDVHILAELLRSAGYYVRIDPDYYFMELRLVIRW